MLNLLAKWKAMQQRRSDVRNKVQELFFNGTIRRISIVHGVEEIPSLFAVEQGNYKYLDFDATLPGVTRREVRRAVRELRKHKNFAYSLVRGESLLALRAI